MDFKTLSLSFPLIVILAISSAVWVSNVFSYTYVTYDAPRPMSPIRCILSVCMPLMMAKRALRKRSLSTSGAVAGVLVGFIMILANYCFFAALCAFFVFGSRVTKYRAATKKKIEVDFKEGGERNWIQVVCNGGIAAHIALIYLLDAGSGERAVNFVTDFSASWWGMAVLGSLASSCGDTFASEIGSVWNVKSRPWLITNFQRVPHGTNGGVSVVGTVASGVGGALVGGAYYLCVVVAVGEEHTEQAPPQYLIVLVAALAGVLGSMVDSLLGACFQYSGYDHERGCVVDHGGPGVEHITGMTLLDNHSVNLVTSLIMAYLTPHIALRTYSYV